MPSGKSVDLAMRSITYSATQTYLVLKFLLLVPLFAIPAALPSNLLLVANRS